MVPFSFKSELSYSRVMKIQLLPSVTVDDRHQPMIGTRTQLGERESREEREGLSSEAPAKGDRRMRKTHLTLDTWPLTPARVQGKSSLETPMNLRKSK
jgi:hypothetical protein